MLLTDVIKRHKILSGRQAVLLTGTDEHGLKIQNAARKAGLEPRIFCDQVSNVFRDLPARANISNDIFIRTSSHEHKLAVSHFWKVLDEEGFIYKDSHEGWYSTSDETFYPTAAIYQDGKHHYSTETGSLVTWTREQNYHFRLSAFKDRLLQFYAENPKFIEPQARYDEVIASVTDGLTDLSISRPFSRLQWGIPVPDDKTQTIYVWLDALVNYITAAGYPETTDLWPADIHVIGKDIVRFHCIYWPAFLMAAGLDLPKKIVTHSHWTMADHKMSKSRGNVADPLIAIERFGIDSVRYFLMRDGRLSDDTNYSNEQLIKRHNNELVHGIGNLVARSTSATFNTTEILSNPPLAQELGDAAKKIRVDAAGIIKHYHMHMDNIAIHKAIISIINLVDRANMFMQMTEPWSKSCAARERLEVIYSCLEIARIASLLLQPIMPDSMQRLLDRLGVTPDCRSFAYAHFGADETYRPMAQKRGGHIFEKIEEENDRDPPSLRNMPRLEKYLEG